jgi:hypothetical protein
MRLTKVTHKNGKTWITVHSDKNPQEYLVIYLPIETEVSMPNPETLNISPRD